MAQSIVQSNPRLSSTSTASGTDHRRNPLLHLMAGLGFFVALAWPFTSFARPIDTWLYLYIVWALCIAASAWLHARRSRQVESGADDV